MRIAHSVFLIMNLISHSAGRCPTMKSANSNINYKKVMEIKFAAMAAVKASMDAYKIQPSK